VVIVLTSTVYRTFPSSKKVLFDRAALNRFRPIFVGRVLARCCFVLPKIIQWV